jgi:hypothetical protein
MAALFFCEPWTDLVGFFAWIFSMMRGKFRRRVSRRLLLLSPLSLELLPAFVRDNYEVHEWRHASAVLSVDFPQEWADILAVLSEFRLYRSEVEPPGGGRSDVARRIDGHFGALGWREHGFSTRVVVDEMEYSAPTHKVDNFKNGVAADLEWNNKTEFYDRDLNNFRLLFDLRAVSVGVIITRCSHLQKIFNALGKGKSYGNSTTHMDKLVPRLHGGSGGGCPVLAVGISRGLYVDDISDPAAFRPPIRKP